ncbi:MAG: porin family protein [Bdellovibrionaceae bacterium]|nr:porin family protein [Pseudobdellovibrionaceae bacterium]
MKRLALIAVLALVPASMVLAQSSLDDEINAELDRMYQVRNSAPSVQVNVQASPNQNQSAGQVTDIGQRTEAKAATVTTTEVETKVVQKQPTTVIEASPLTESRADRLRKARQDAEMKTEEKLVERIEHSRLEDERRRAEVLFGDRFNKLMNQSEQKAAQETEQKQIIVNENYGVQGDVTQGAQASSQQTAVQEQKAQPVMVDVPAQQPVYVPVPVIVQQPEVKKAEESQVVIIDKKEETIIDREAIKNELRAELDSHKKNAEHEAETETRGYVAGMIGMGDFPDVQNVRGNYSLGFAIGTKINDRMLVEGTFQYSNFSIEQMDSGPWGYDPYYSRITEMDQYTGSGVIKYQLLGGSFRPVVGGVLAYNYRTFSDVQLAFGNNDASSHAVDVGLMAGADIEVTRSFSIGADVRYMWNVFNRSSSDGFQRRFSQQVIGTGTPIEELNYLNFSLVGRATF